MVVGAALTGVIGFFVVVAGAAPILVPGVPLVPILVLTQILNAVLLLPLLGFLYGLARNRDLLGDQTVSRPLAATYLLAIAAIAACILALGLLTVLD